MFENIVNFFKKLGKKEEKKQTQENSKDAAKERLHLVLMQDRANVSADFLELMKQEIIEVIKKYIDIDEKEIDVRLTNKENEDGTNGAPALYANIPILNIKNDLKKISQKDDEEKQEQQGQTNKVIKDKKEENDKKKESQNKEETKNEIQKKKEIEESKVEKLDKTEEKEKDKEIEEVKESEKSIEIKKQEESNKEQKSLKKKTKKKS